MHFGVVERKWICTFKYLNLGPEMQTWAVTETHSSLCEMRWIVLTQG